MMNDSVYLDVSQENGRDFMTRAISGPITMLNLLRFKPVADYSMSPELKPAGDCTGKEAFDRYIQHTLPFLDKSGGELLFYGEGGQWLIGPSGDGWDAAMLVRQASVEAFMAWNADSAYLAGIGHRTAALSDSRILPLIEKST
tara:strand:- start:706 stop:1134 length:429 start_codon:yes stop_codon:yes gene_type:complete